MNGTVGSSTFRDLDRPPPPPRFVNGIRKLRCPFQPPPQYLHAGERRCAAGGKRVSWC
jgi:hypothetical protein